MSEELEEAWKEAVSFPGSSPPENAREIGQIERDGNTFILYRGRSGYYYNTLQGIRFAKEMEERARRKNKRRGRKRKSADESEDTSAPVTHAHDHINQPLI